jgi:hypothetical protein
LLIYFMEKPHGFVENVESKVRWRAIGVPLVFFFWLSFQLFLRSFEEGDWTYSIGLALFLHDLWWSIWNWSVRQNIESSSQTTRCSRGHFLGASFFFRSLNTSIVTVLSVPEVLHLLYSVQSLSQLSGTFRSCVCVYCQFFFFHRCDVCRQRRRRSIQHNRFHIFACALVIETQLGLYHKH